jgi:hypothetical protein
MDTQLYAPTDDRPFSYVFQARLNQLVVYYEHARSESKSQVFQSNKKQNFKGKQTYGGEISKDGQKKLRKAIETLYVITPRRQVFNRVLNKYTNFHLSSLTLTLSYLQGKWLDSEVVKFCLAPFILDCRRKLGLNNYVWKAERQQNGNIHFHVISDMFGDIETIKKFWNDKQDTLGFIDKFYERHKHRQPPSIEITYVRNSDTLGKYVSKYISKSKGKHSKQVENHPLYPVTIYLPTKANEKLYKEMEQRRWEFISGRVWDCSMKLKQFKYNSVDLSTSDRDSVDEIVKLLSVRKFDSNYFSVIQFKNDNYIRHMPLRLKQSYYDQYHAVIEQNIAEHMTNRLKIYT